MVALNRSNCADGLTVPEHPTAGILGLLTLTRGWDPARWTSVRLICLFFVLTIPIPCTARPVSRSLFKGTVTDAEGAAIRGAHVTVRWDSAGADVGLQSNVGIKHEIGLVTDNSGSFASELPPGFYDVFVSATAFSPECRKIRVKPGLTFVYKARLKLDPLVRSELGDTVPK